MDAWRRLRKSPAKLIARINVKWSGVPKISDGEVSIDSPITLICGENGAGKSTLLSLIFGAVSGGEESQFVRPHEGVIETIAVEVDADGKGNLRTIVGEEVADFFSPADADSRVAFIDTGMQIPAMLGFIARDANFSDYLEGLSTKRFDKTEIAQASYVVGREYEEIDVFEIEDSALGQPFPYFKVRAFGTDYGSESMGFGELAALYLIWAVSRIPAGSILLIEEPETFLAPFAQTAILDVLADVAPKKMAKIVMTSHSGAIATRLRNSEVIYLTRAMGSVTITHPAKSADLIHRLGLVPATVLIYVVEDEVALIFARSLVERYSHALSGRGEYCNGMGESAVVEFLKKVPQGLERVTHIGILDGDMRGQGERHVGIPVAYLPGDVSPEAVLIDFIKRSGSAIGVELFDCEEADFARGLAFAEGRDPHDYFQVVADTIAVHKLDLIRRLSLRWAMDNQALVVDFVRDLEKVARIPRD